MPHLADVARDAPRAIRGVRPMTEWREDLITMALAVWPITAMFFDGRNHNKGIGWTPTQWVGALIVGILTSFGVAFLIAPPAYGPRLVEAD